MSDYIWLNGQYVTKKDAKISLFESGLLYGYGVFETIMIHYQNPFQLTAHYERLKDSARHIRMPVHISLKSLQTAINKLVQLNRIVNGFVRMVVSSSEEPTKAMKFSSSDYDTNRDPSQTGKYYTSMILIETGPISPDYEKYRQSGVSVMIYPHRRSPETAYYRHKTLAYMENLLVRRWAFKNKALEGIYVNTDDYLMEGTRSSLFIVKDHKVFTPSIESNILSGVTRKVVIGLCTKNTIKIREKLLQKDDIFSADEAFLTSSLMEVMPVTRIKIESDREVVTKTIKDGLVGPITRRLQNSYRELLETS